MPIPVERLTTVVGNIQTYLPDAIGGELDISRYMRLGGSVRAILNATVEPPMAEVRFITASQPSAEKPLVLREWGMRMSHPRAEDPLAAPGVRLQSTQIYDWTEDAARASYIAGTTQTLTSDHLHHRVHEDTFVEVVVNSVIAELCNEAAAPPA